VIDASPLTTSQRSPAEGPPAYVFGPFRLEVAERRLSRDGADIALTRKTFDLLLALVECAGHLRTREALIEALWPHTIVEEHTLTWNLSALRRALGDTGASPSYIETVRGHGYRFIAEVSREGAGERVAADTAAAAGAGAAPEASSEEAVVRPASARAWRRPAFAAAGFLLALFAAVLLWRASGEAGPSAPAPPRSVAVMPFQNLSPDPANAYFASGIQDTILTKLAGIHDLRVVSRRSTEGYRSRPAGIDRIARELHVGHLLEGSVQKAGDQVLINVQLIDGLSGDHLWAHTYTRSMDKVFDVQSDVAEQVAQALRAQLLPDEASRVASRPTQDPRAYDLFLKAEYLALQIEVGSARSPAAATEEARAYYQQAIARDPAFALAMARLSYLDGHAYWLDLEHTPARAASAQEWAARALAADPELPQARLAMGYVHYYCRRDYAAAQVEFERALQDLPNDADANASIANINRRRGRWTEALDGYERAAALDPRNPQWPMLKADTLTMLRRYADAQPAYEQARAIDPDSTTVTLFHALSLLMDGRFEQAARMLDALPRETDPEGLGTSIRFVAAWLAGDADAALVVLATAPAMVDAPWTPNFVPVELLRAQAFELKGDRDGARAAYLAARDKLRRILEAQPDDPAALSALGLALAGLGEKEAALAAGRRAVELLPVERDAVDGPYYPATLADIEIRVGEPAAAVTRLRALLERPAGRVISRALIARDPRYATVRDAVLGGAGR
jgi:TolB-like protein/DNA-binding winged helix-turn-helix (wHTH) protein/cytochrome c-type biogenesis protein CcmH/NrfG